MKDFEKINNLSIICFKLRNSTDKMFSVMKENYPKLEVTDEVDP